MLYFYWMVLIWDNVYICIYIFCLNNVMVHSLNCKKWGEKGLRMKIKNSALGI